MAPDEVAGDLYWMARALELAAIAEKAGEVPVGAVVVREERLLGEGWNQPIGTCDPSAHAEIQALRAAAGAEDNYRLPGATLYVTVEPCTMCAGALIHSRIARLVFAAAEPRAGAIVSNLNILDQTHFNHHIDWLGGVREAEASALMRAFFRRRRQEAQRRKLLSARATPGIDQGL